MHQRAPNYVTQIFTDLKGEIDSNIKTVDDINTLLRSMGRSSRQKMSKKTSALKGTLEQMDLKYTTHRIQKQQNTYSLLESTRNILQDRSCEATKQVLIN